MKKDENCFFFILVAPNAAQRKLLSILVAAIIALSFKQLKGFARSLEVSAVAYLLINDDGSTKNGHKIQDNQWWQTRKNEDLVNHS